MSQYMLLVGGIIVLGVVMQVVGIVIHNNSKKKYKMEHPEVSVMEIKDNPFHPLGFTNTLTCLSINGEPTIQFMTGYGKRGHYLLPGKNILELQYETQRPGILHKWVRTTYDPQKIEVNVEPNKKYTISYNKKQDQFLFEEVA